ncbi:ATP-binding protein [Virgisporangium aurantiacum]|nr:helix-turn-helix transcriptional regulator [Virgisporangium aurantiacum]
MIGRADELRRLRGLLDAARDGAQPGIALIAGEPGVGKSRLVHELISGMATRSGTLIGQADPGALGRPFELLLDALDGAAPGAAAELQAAIADPAVGPVERLRAGLDAVRANDPDVVVFEDLHWADSESVALFERLGDLPGSRLLVGTYRPGEVDRRNPAADLLTRLERRYPVTYVRLERLSLDDTSALLTAMTGRRPPYRAAVALQNRTGGNPFFLEELVKAAGGGELDLRKLSVDPLPWNLADTLRRQLDELDHTQERVIEAAAVLGRKVPFDLLAVVTGLAEDDLIEVLRELVRRGLLVELGDDEFGFRHALAREAISEQLLGRQRRRLHELAYETLAAADDSDVALIAHHAKGAGRYDDMVAAVRRGVEKYLRMGSTYQALQLAEMGLAEVPDDVELLAVAARSAWLVGLLDDAHRYAKMCLRCATNTGERSGALRLMARVAWESGRRDEMSSLIDRLCETIQDLPDNEERAAAMAAIAQSFMLRDLTQPALRWADKAVELADRLGLPDIRVTALVEKGSALVNDPAQVDSGRALLREVADEAEKAGVWLAKARALNNLLSTPYPLSADEQRDLLEHMRIAAEKAGFDSLAVAAYFQGRASLAIHDGDLTAAIAAIDDGRRRDQGVLRTSQGDDYHGAFRAGLALEAGDVDLAASISVRLMESMSAFSKGRTGILGLAYHVACRQGDQAAAERALDELLNAADGRKIWGDMLHDLVSAGLFARIAPERLRPLSANMGGFAENWRTLVEAQLTEAERHPAEALDGYRRAMLADDLPAAVRGTAHVGAARCLVALGRRDEAAALLDPATRLLENWDGWRVAELAELRDLLGAREHPVGGDSQLTPRELEVAHLLAEGLTNAELARRLFISPRTAAVHVSNILSKLGVSSRTQVADRISSAAPGTG